MKHTERQESWSRAAREPGPDLARGLFALLSEPNADERAAGITTSPLDDPAAGSAVPAGGPNTWPANTFASGDKLRCVRCGRPVGEHEPGECRDDEPEPDAAA